MIYIIEPNDDARSMLFLEHEVHWGIYDQEYEQQFAADPALISMKYRTASTYFIRMNPLTIKFDYRLASSYCWNYTQMLDGYLQGIHYELHVPVPNGMQYHHSGFKGEPYYNYTHAQKILLDSSDPEIQTNLSLAGGYGLNKSSSRAEWRNAAESTIPVAYLNFSMVDLFITFSSELCFLQLEDNLKDIGIKLSLQIYEYPLYIIDPPIPYDLFGFSTWGWSPSYIDPITMVEPIYGTDQNSNPFSWENSTWNNKILSSYNLTGEARRNKFHEIQEDFCKYIVPSFYVLQFGSNICFNREFLDENSVGDLLNMLSYRYWFNCKIIYEPPKISGYNVVFIMLIFGITALSIYKKMAKKK
jgi:hypothetical protein